MSKIGKRPIHISEGIEAEIKEGVISFKGPNASLEVPILPGIKVEKTENQIVFIPQDNAKQTLSNWGTLRALAQNAILGAVKDFSKDLVIEGVGYRANVEGEYVILNLGYSHQIRFRIPEGIKIKVEKNTVNISGADKILVGETAAQIRKFRKPEPYKGKGIRYSDEVIKRKVGKRAAGKTS